MITVSMLIHWILLVIFIGSCIFLFLGFAGSVLLLQWISYTAWRDPSTTMWEKISITPWAILGLIMEVGLINAWLPRSNSIYWAIFLMALGCHTLAILYLARLDPNAVRSLVAEALARRSEKRALRRRSSH